MMDDRRFSLVLAVEDELRARSLRNLSSSISSMSSSILSPPRAGLPRPAFSTCPNSSPSRDLRPKHVQQQRLFEDYQGDENDGLAPASRSSRDRDQDQDQDQEKAFYEECAAAAARAVSAVRRVEGAAAAAEREYAKTARSLVRLRAAAALNDRSSDTTNHGGGDVGNEAHTSPAAASREKGSGGAIGLGHGPVKGTGPGTQEGAGDGRGDLAGCGCGSCVLLYEANERLLQEVRARGFLA